MNENDLNKEVNKVIKRANDLFILQNAQNEQNDLINIQENEIFQKTEKSTKNQRKKEKKLEEVKDILKEIKLKIENQEECEIIGEEIKEEKITKIKDENGNIKEIITYNDGNVKEIIKYEDKII